MVSQFIVLGISEELAAKAEKASLEELKDYVEKSRHDEAVEENKTLKTQVAYLPGAGRPDLFQERHPDLPYRHCYQDGRRKGVYH